MCKDNLHRVNRGIEKLCKNRIFIDIQRCQFAK